MRSLTSALCSAALVAASACPVACVKHDTDTQITVTITSEARVPAELGAIQVSVFGADGSLRYDRAYEVVESTFFPTTLAVIPSDQDSLRAPVTVEVRGFLGGNQLLLLRRAVVSFVEGRSLYLPMPLRMACFQQTSCNATESCVGGTCKSATVNTSKLTDYADALVFDTAPGATCFHEDTCLASAQKVTPASDCTFPLPNGAAGDGAKPSVNAAVEWGAAQGRMIALDEGDAVEGWTIEGGVGRLSPGICQALSEPLKGGPIPDNAIALWVATGCAPKSGEQPYCRASDGSVGVGRPTP